jgi:hypothetical protein
MDAGRCLELHHLRREILSARDRGRVVIEFADGMPVANLAEARQVADGMIALVNLPLLGPHWFQADRDRAARILTEVLHWDLETLSASAPEWMARQLTEKLLSQFHGDTTYLTNVRSNADLNQSPHRWASGRDQAELDAGVAIVSPDLVGLLWVEDRPA